MMFLRKCSNLEIFGWLVLAGLVGTAAGFLITVLALKTSELVGWVAGSLLCGFFVGILASVLISKKIPEE